MQSAIDPNYVHPTDDDTTEEEFPAKPEDDDSTDDELVGAQPEDARSAVWYQSRAGHLAMAAGMFEPPIPFIDPAWRRPSSTTHCMTDSPFNPGVWNMPNTTAKTTPKSAKGAMPRTKNAVFKALLRDMHALQPDCLAPPMPLVRPRRSSAPEPVNLAIDLDIVVAAYAETKAAYDIYCDGLRGRLEALEPHVKSVTFHVLTDRLTMEKFPGFRANGLGAFTSWVHGAGPCTDGHESGYRLASFRLMYAAMLAEAYTVKDMQRPSMVPADVTWVSTGARRVVMVQDADETAGGQMLDLIAYGVSGDLSMCFLGTPPAANYHTPLIAQMLFFPPESTIGRTSVLRPVFYGQLYAALVRSMSGTLAVKDACQGYAEDEVLMIQVLLDVQRMVGAPVLANGLRDCNIGLASIKWPQDESVSYVLAQSVAEKDFMQKPETALFYNNEAKLAWSRDGSDRSVLFVHK